MIPFSRSAEFRYKRSLLYIVFPGTTAKVSFILSGDKDETAPRMIEDTQRQILRRGGVDTFIMAVPQALGNLTHLR